MFSQKNLNRCSFSVKILNTIEHDCVVCISWPIKINTLYFCYCIYHLFFRHGSMTMIKESLDCLLMENGWNQMAEKHTRQKTLPLVSYWFIFKKIHQNIILNPTVNPCHDIAETLLKLALNTNQSINPNEPQKGLYDIEIVFLMLGAIPWTHVHWSSRMCQ